MGSKTVCTPTGFCVVRSGQAGTSHLSHLTGVSHLKEGNPQIFGKNGKNSAPSHWVDIKTPSGAQISICQVSHRILCFRSLIRLWCCSAFTCSAYEVKRHTPLSMLRTSVKTRASLHPSAVCLGRGKGIRAGSRWPNGTMLGMPCSQTSSHLVWMTGTASHFEHMTLCGLGQWFLNFSVHLTSLWILLKCNVDSVG